MISQVNSYTATIDWLRSIGESEQFEKSKDNTNNFFMLYESSSDLLSSQTMDDEKFIDTCKENSSNIATETFKKMYKFHDVLGNGRNKRAFLIQEVVPKNVGGYEFGNIESDALILPTTRVGKKMWKDIVHIEVVYSKMCLQLKLLTIQIKEVKIQRMESDGQFIGDGFSAYMTPSFPSLSQKGLFIIDNQHPEKSSWKCGISSLFPFQPKPSLDNLEIWDSIVIPLFKDLGKIYSHCTRMEKDALNLCIQKINLGKNMEAYQARLFLYDFEGCFGSDVKECTTDEEYVLEKAERKNKFSRLCADYEQNPDLQLFKNYKTKMVFSIKQVITAEYGRNKLANNSVQIFVNALIDRHFKIFLWKVLKNFDKPNL